MVRPREGAKSLFDVPTAVHGFFQEINTGHIEIYNECSLQHELAIFLRGVGAGGPYKIQFERPVCFFGVDRTQQFVKNETICHYSPPKWPSEPQSK